MKWEDILRDESLREQWFTDQLPESLPALLSLAMRWEGNVPDADDLIQDALIQAWHKLDLLQDPQRFRSWVRRILNNCAATRYKRRRCHLPMPVDGFVDPITPENLEEALSTTNPLHSVADFLHRTTPGQRETAFAALAAQNDREEMARTLKGDRREMRIRIQRLKDSFAGHLRRMPQDREHPFGVLRQTLAAAHAAWKQTIDDGYQKALGRDIDEAHKAVDHNLDLLAEQLAGPFKANPVSVQIAMMVWDHRSTEQLPRISNGMSGRQFVEAMEAGVTTHTFPYAHWMYSHAKVMSLCNIEGQMLAYVKAWDSIRRCPAPDRLATFALDTFALDVMQKIVDYFFRGETEAKAIEMLLSAE